MSTANPNLATRRLAQAIASWWARPAARASLADVDDRTLADLGVHRSEIGSIEAESQRLASQRTRLRLVAETHPA